MKRKEGIYLFISLIVLLFLVLMMFSLNSYLTGFATQYSKAQFEDLGYRQDGSMSINPSAAVVSSLNENFQITVNVNADAILHRGFYSINGNSWQGFNFFGNNIYNRWLEDSATKTLTFSASDFDFDENNVSNDNYIITYTCDRNGLYWTCDDRRWQIEQFSVYLNESGNLTMNGTNVSSSPPEGLEVGTQETTAFWDRSYYTTENSMKLYMIAESDGIANVNIKNENGNSVYQNNNVQLTKGENILSFPRVDFSLGIYNATITITPAGKSALTFNDRLRILPPLTGGGKEVKVDKYNRCVLVDGEPFFPYGAIIGITNNYSGLAEEGFNSAFRWSQKYSVGTYGGITQAALNDDMWQVMNDDDLMLIDRPFGTRFKFDGQYAWDRHDITNDWVAFYNDWLNNDVPELLSTTQHFDNLLGNAGSDESTGARLPYTKAATTKFQEEDPYHLSFSDSFGASVNAKQTEYEDVIVQELYWEERGKLQKLASSIEYYRDFAKTQNKPLWTFPLLEDDKVASPYSMTVQEQEADVYLNLAQGATGLFYFIWPTKQRNVVQLHQRLANEIDTLSPALLRRPPVQKIFYDVSPTNHPSAILLGLRSMPDGTPVLIIVNKAEYSVDMTLHLPWISSSDKLVRLVDRGYSNIDLTNKEYTETLGPLETRAYKIVGTTIANNELEYVLELTEVHSDQSAYPIELLSDPGFDTGDDWTLTGEGIEFSNSTLCPSQNSCLHINRTSESQSANYVKSPVFNIKDENDYLIEAKVKYNTESTPGTGRVGVAYWGPAPSDLYFWRQFGPVINSGSITANGVPSYIKIQAYGFKGNYWVDNLKFLDLGKTNPILSTNKNKVPNSGFEYARIGNWPDLWRPLYINPFVNDHFLGDSDAPFRQDSTDAYDGQYSLRVDFGDKDQSKVAQIGSRPYGQKYEGIYAEDGKNYTLSVYMKANKDTQVNMIIPQLGGTHTFTVGTTWKRYSFTASKSNTRNDFIYGISNIYVSGGERTLWFDDFQLEEGNVATAYVPDTYVPKYAN